MDNQERITVLHLTTSLGTGGMERQLLLTTPLLSGMHHVIVCLQQWGAIGDELRRRGFAVYHIPTRFPWSVPSILRLHSLVHRYRPKIVITYLPFADLFGRLWARLAGIPKVVCYLHSTMREPRYFPLIVLNNLTQLFVSRFFAVSNAVRMNYEHWGLSSGKTDVIPNGIEVSSEEVPRQFCEQLRLIANVPQGASLIGYVGGLRKERGHLFLLRAIRLLKDDGRNVHVLFVGDGPYRPVIEQYASDLGVGSFLTFLGRRDDVSRILRCLAVYVHPSTYEGMSVALLEAMAAGCAIVTTDIPENREILTNTTSALMVRRGDDTAFAAAIGRILDDQQLARGLGVHAHERAQDFAIQRTVRGLEKAIRRIV